VTRDVDLFEAVAFALGQEAEPSRALERTLEIVARALDLAAGWVWLLDPDSERFYLAASHGLPPYLQEPVQMTGSSCWCIESFEDGDFVSQNVQVIDCSRLRKALREDRSELTGGMKSHASIALRFGERQLGIMNLSRPDWRPLEDDELRLLGAIGMQVGIAVERARLAESAASLARSDERARLAREVHDTLAQDLTALTLQLERALRRASGESNELRGPLENALAVARVSLDHARESVLSLRSDPLDGKPLPAALAALTRRFTSESGILVDVRVESVAGLPHAYEIELYRIAAEALRNVARHARARRVEVVLISGERDVRLTIGDDGTGYDAARADEGRYGVVGMAERARSLGGTFSIEANPAGKGTLVSARLPR
jgi:two-component system NarL family sensor kinase